MDKISPFVLTILTEQAVIDDSTVRLTSGDLGDDYKSVDDVLKRCGGKWNTSKQLHLFARGTDNLRIALDSGILPPKNPLAFFPTPHELASMVCDRSGAHRGCKILEPSAGHGAFAKCLRDEHDVPVGNMDLIEFDPYNCAELRHQGFQPHEMDFMDWKPDYTYDCVIMNPPFSVKGDPIAHVTHFLHAYDMWHGDKGNMVAILPPTHIPNWCFSHERGKGCSEISNNPKIQRYQRIIEEFGHTESNPPKAFRESGTDIDTVTVLLLG